MNLHEKMRELDAMARRILDVGVACPGEPSGKLFTFAESCTGGLVASIVTGVPGVSAVFPGSLVTYSDLSKIEQLDVTPETLRDHGAVSGECAAEMAWGALRRFDTRVSVSVTGIAGPDGGSERKPVGTVWFAVCRSDGMMRLKKCLYRNRGRRGVRISAAYTALELLLLALDEF